MTKYLNAFAEILEIAEKSAKDGGKFENKEALFFIGMLTGVMITATNDETISLRNYEDLSTANIETRKKIFQAFGKEEV